jgi:hypothetical protein
MFGICSYSELPQQTTITNPSQFSVLFISCQLLYNISKSLLILLLPDACNIFSVTFECFMYKNSLYCAGCVFCTFMTYFTSYFHGLNSGPVVCVCVCVCARMCVYTHTHTHTHTLWNVLTVLLTVILSHIHISLMFCHYISVQARNKLQRPYSPRSSIHFLARCSKFYKTLKKNQNVVLRGSNDLRVGRNLAKFQLFFSSPGNRW